MTVQSSSQPYVTFEDFVAQERDSPTKHEWLDGVVYAMAGGTVEHARLATNINAVLRTRLVGRCTVLSSDAMVCVRETNLATYPDGSVICGPVDIQKVERDGKSTGEAVMNPTLIVEVLSDSTESYDRGEKFAHYMRLASLREYVLVAQDERRVEIFRRPRGRGHWEHVVARDGESFEVCGERIATDEIYGA